jgi:hypothetical protein
MRNILQLLGGVAVAGAVAAGSTAFTASGLTGLGTPVLGGGKVTQTVTGATVTGITLTSTTPATPDRIDGMVIKLAGDGGVAIPTGSKVTIVSDGTDSAGTLEFYCGATVVDSGVIQKTTCVVGTAANTPTGYITAISTMDIQVEGA